jgi:hypothetical protein
MTALWNADIQVIRRQWAIKRHSLKPKSLADLIECIYNHYDIVLLKTLRAVFSIVIPS